MFAELVSRVLRNCHPEFHHPSLGATDLGACLPNAPVLVRSDFALRKHLFRAAVGSTVSIVPDTFKFREMRGAVGGPKQPIKPYVSVAQMSVFSDRVLDVTCLIWSDANVSTRQKASNMRG